MKFKKKCTYNPSFDVFANNYHSVRPGYPALLFEDIKNHCGIDDDSHLLEIGAGSGIATVELAKLGCHIIAIEPGAHLAAIAREQIGNFRNAEVFEGTFEVFAFQSVGKFNTILAFTAFHWLGKRDKYQQVFDLLNDSGILVLIWNSFFQNDSPATVEVNSACQKLLPEIYQEKSTVADVNKSVLSKLNRREQEVVINPLFYPIFLRRYLATYNYDSETYPKLLITFPKVIGVEEQRRLKFLERVSEVVAKHGKISVPVLTTMIICQKKSCFLETVSKS